MSKVRPTPAPWNTVEFEAELYVMEGRPASNICRVDNHNKYANARLITAAPDYYEACESLPQITEGESTSDYDKRVLAWFYCHAGKIYAANKKVMGL